MMTWMMAVAVAASARLERSLCGSSPRHQDSKREQDYVERDHAELLAHDVKADRAGLQHGEAGGGSKRHSGHQPKQTGQDQAGRARDFRSANEQQ